jgi:hypothetical protein
LFENHTQINNDTLICVERIIIVYVERIKNSGRLTFTQ